MPFWLTLATRDNRLRRLAVHVPTAVGFARQFADRRQALVDGRWRELHFPEPGHIALHRLARDGAPRRPDKELFEGVVIGLPGVRRYVIRT